MQHRLKWEGVLGYLAFQAWTVLIGSFWFWFRLAKTGASAPDHQTGQIAGLSNHGQWYYVYPWQKSLMYGAGFCAIVVFMIAVFLIQKFYGEEALAKFRFPTLALAIVGGILFWGSIARFGGL